MKLLSILGPTGIGKSALAIQLAKELDSEIISCDSMLVYRGMDIGTAKPSLQNQKEVTHHLIDILDFKEPYNVSLYVKNAKACLDKIQNKGKIPILCGGTGLYAQAFIEGYQFYPRDELIAKKINRIYESGGCQYLINELQQVDPTMASKVQNNPHRLMRTVEIFWLTGKVPQFVQSYQTASDVECVQCVLIPCPDLLRKRIERRTSKMLSNGWLEETEKLISQGFLDSPTASKALGYRLISSYLKGHISSKSELHERIVRGTCQYAKRQRTWFRNRHQSAKFVELNKEWNTQELVDRVLPLFMDG